MADKQIVDFPGSPSFTDSTIFHIWDVGVNKKIAAVDMVAEIGSRIAPDASTTQKGVVQLSNSTDSNSQTTAATSLAVATVATSLTNLSDNLGTAAFTDSSDYATAEQGAKADMALPATSVVTGPSDTTPNRVVNTQWDFYRAVHQKSSIDSRTNPAVNVDEIPYGERHLVGGTNPGSLPPGVGQWDVGSTRMHGATGYQFAHSINSSADFPIYYRWKSSGETFVGRDWLPVIGGSGSGGGIPEAPIDGRQYARKDAGWTEVIAGSGSADPGIVSFGEVATSGSQAITLDLSQGSAFYASLETANTTGTLSLGFSNIPASGNVDGYIVIQRAGRKPINLPSGSRYAGSLTPAFLGTSGSTTVVQFYRFSNMTPGRFIFAVNQGEGAL